MLSVRIQDQELDGDGDGSQTPPPPPFHVNPHERLVVLTITTSPIDLEPFELHVPAQALLEQFWVKRDPGAVVPWSAWRADISVTPLSKEPYLQMSRMVTYGMRTVSQPPDWEEGVLYLYSYTPRTAGTVRARSGVGTRQGIPLPDDLPFNFGEDEIVFSVLCEDGLLLHQVMSVSSRLIGRLTDA